MKNLIKISLVFGGILLAISTIAYLFIKLTKSGEEDDDVDYVNYDYDDLECMPNINGVSLSGDDDIDIDVE